jgi:hypothetical protein
VLAWLGLMCGYDGTANGIKVISQRDFASLEILYSKIDEAHIIDAKMKDHHEIDWYREYFKDGI